MFETEGMPAGVIAVRAVGRATAADYRAVMNPAIEQATEGGRKARLYIELGEGFEGYDSSAILADTALGLGNFTSFERIAVVTDTDWIRHAIQLFGWLIPGDVRVFAVGETAGAREWIAARP
jgi:hypothetical protein